MKKVILGSMMFLTGVLSLAVLLAGSMAHDWTLNGCLSASWNISQFGLTPALYGFLAIAAIGLFIALWGLADKHDS